MASPEGGSNNIGSLEVSVVANLSDALEKLTLLEEKLASINEMANQTVQVHVDQTGTPARRGRAQAAGDQPPAAATAAASGVQNVNAKVNLNEEELAAHFRRAAEAAFEEPINVTLRIANLEQLRDQLGAVNFTGGQPSAAAQGAAGIVPQRVLTKEFTDAIHAGGQNLKGAFLDLIGTIGDFSDELGGVRIEGADDMAKFADVIGKVLPGLANFDFDAFAAKNRELVSSGQPGQRLADLGKVLSPIYGINPGLDAGIEEVLAKGSSNLVRAARSIGAAAPITVTPEPSIARTSIPQAALVAATASPTNPEAIAAAAAAAIDKIEAKPTATGTAPKGLSIEEFTSLIRGKIGLPGGQALDFSRLREIPAEGTAELASFLNPQGAGRGFRSAIPGLGADVEKVIQAVKFFEAVGQVTSGPDKGKFVAPEPGTPDYEALSAIRGRGVGYLSGGTRVRRVNPQELLRQVFSTFAQGDTGELLGRLTYNAGADYPSILSRAFRASRNQSVVLNQDVRSSAGRSPNETSATSAGGLLSPSAYGSRGLQGYAQMNLEYARLNRMIEPLLQVQATSGLRPADARRLDRLTARREQLVEAGAQPLDINLNDLRRINRLQKQLNLENASRVSGGVGLDSEELTAHLRQYGFSSMLPASLAAKMSAGEAPDIRAIVQSLISEVYSPANRQAVETREGKIVPGSEVPASQYVAIRAKQILEGVQPNAERGIAARPGLTQMVAGLPREQQRDILGAFTQMTTDLKSFVRGFGPGGAALPGRGFSRERPFLIEDVDRSQAGNGGYTQPRRRQPTTIDLALQDLEGKAATQLGAKATEGELRSETLRRERPSYVAERERNAATTGTLQFEDEAAARQRRREAEAEYGFTFQPGRTGYKGMQTEGRTVYTGPLGREEESRKMAARAAQSPLLFPELAGPVISRQELEDQSGQAGLPTKETAEELSPDQSAVARSARAIDRRRRALRRLQERAIGLYRQSATDVGVGSEGEVGLDQLNAIRERIEKAELKGPGAALVRQEALDFSQTRAPGAENTLIPTGRGHTPADAAAIDKLVAKAHNFVPGEENPTPFKEALAALGMAPAAAGAGGNGAGAPPHLTAMAGGPGGEGGGFAGSGTYRVFVTNWPENIGTGAGGGARLGPPTAEDIAQGAQARYRRRVLDFRRQTTPGAQNVLNREIERLRSEGKSDAAIGRYARDMGLPGVGLLLDNGPIGGLGGNPRENGLIGRYLGATDRFSAEPSDRFLATSAEIRSMQGRLQQRSIPTTLVTLAENLFGGRQGPTANIIEAQRALSRFQGLDTRLQFARAARSNVQAQLESGVDQNGNPLTKRATTRLTEDFNSLGKIVEQLEPEHEALGKEVTRLAKSAVGASDIMRNLAAGAVGGIAGVAVGQGIAMAAQLAIRGVATAAGPTIEHALGDPNTAARIANSLSQAFRQAGGNLGAIAATAGQTNISAAGFARISQPLESRAATTAGDEALREQIDLIRAAANIAQSNKNLGGFDLGLFQTTGGLFGTPIGGTPSASEIFGNELSNLPGNRQGRTGYLQGLIDRASPGTTPAQQESLTALGVFRDDLAKAGGGLQLLQDKSGKSAVAIEELAKNAEKFGRTDWARLIRQQGFFVQGATGPDQFAQLMQQAVVGAQTFDPSLLLQGLSRQIKSTVQTENQATFRDLTQTIPGGFGISQALNPIGNLAAPLRALGGTATQVGDISRLVGQVSQAASDGQQAAQAFVQQNLPEYAGQFANDLSQAAGYGRQIADLQIGVATEQAAYAASQYAYQLFIAKRALTDAKGLAGDITSQNGDNLGVLERSNFLLGQQSTILGQTLQQRQINFNLAIAGFTAPGLTPEERAARIEQAKIEASFAQKQLDIQRQLTANQRAAFGITSRRGVTDLTRQVGLLQQGFRVNVDTQAAEAKMKALSTLQAQEAEKVNRLWSAAQQRANDLLSIEGQLVTQTGKDLDQVAQDVLGAFGKVFSGITAQMQQQFASPMGGSPNQQPAIPGHGQTTVHINVYGDGNTAVNGTQRQTLQHVTRVLGRAASIQGLRN